MEYRRLLRDRRTRRLMIGLGVSALGDGMSAVTIAWLALKIGDTASYVGVAVAAYTLPGVVGALGAAQTLAVSGAATVALAVVGALLWPRRPAREDMAEVGYGHLP